MIGKIKGTLTEIDGTIGLIETSSGVFYEVFLPTSLNALIPPLPMEIYTYFHVREDVQILFGFENKQSLQLFKLLLSVSGVGPKTAFSVISYSPAEEFLKAVRNNDAEFFTRVPGLGRKTALKIILELSQKLKSEFKMDQAFLSDEDKTVIDALVSLGFKTQEARQIFQKIDKSLSLEDKITEGIRLATNPKKK